MQGPEQARSGSPGGWTPPPLRPRRSPDLRASDGGSGGWLRASQRNEWTLKRSA
jgi:hypothetical protein